MAVEFTRLDRSDVDVRLVQDLEGIALESWSEAFKATRDQAEVEEKFNPNNRQHVAEALGMYRGYAQHGVLMLASETVRHPGGAVSRGRIGFGLVRNDVSPLEGGITGAAVRTIKRAESLVVPGNKSKVYTKVGLLAVCPDRWGEGIGTELLHESLRPFRYRLGRMSTAYVYQENPSRDWFVDRGYDEPEEFQDKDVFNNPDRPVQQGRYTGLIHKVLAATALKVREYA